MVDSAMQAMIIEELARRTPSLFVQHAPTFFNNVLSPALLDARTAVRERAEDALAAALAVASSRETLFARKLEKRRLLPYQLSVAVPHPPTPTPSTPTGRRGSAIFTTSDGGATGAEFERSLATGTLTRAHATLPIDAYIWCESPSHSQLILELISLNFILSSTRFESVINCMYEYSRGLRYSKCFDVLERISGEIAKFIENAGAAGSTRRKQAAQPVGVLPVEDMAHAQLILFRQLLRIAHPEAEALTSVLISLMSNHSN